MRAFVFAISSALNVAPVPTAAQDFESMASDNLSSAGSFAGTVSVNSNLDTTARAARTNPSSTARQAEACAKRAQFAAAHGKDHPKVRELYRLCANAGY